MSAPVLPRRAALAALAGAGAALGLPKLAKAVSAAADPIPALCAESLRTVDLINGGCHVTEAETDALMDRWCDCDVAAIATRATTPAGAIASIEWARGELLEFGFERGGSERGPTLILPCWTARSACCVGRETQHDRSCLARRTILASLAAVPLAACVPTPTPAATIVADPTIALIEKHRAAFAAFDVACRRDDGDGVEPECEAERQALDALLTSKPTTLDGLRALAVHMAAYDDKTDDWQTAQWALAILAEACRRLIPTGDA